MFIAMNRFKIHPGHEEEFERIWREVDGFAEFHLLKGSSADDHTLYSSHAVWTALRGGAALGPESSGTEPA